MGRIWFLNFQLSNSHYCLISILCFKTIFARFLPSYFIWYKMCVTDQVLRKFFCNMNSIEKIAKSDGNYGWDWNRVICNWASTRTYIHSVAKVYAVFPFYYVKCLSSGGREWGRKPLLLAFQYLIFMV